MNLPGLTQRHSGKVLALVTLLILSAGLYTLMTADKRPPLPELPPAVTPFMPAMDADTKPLLYNRHSLPAENIFRSTGLTDWINAHQPPAPPPEPTPVPDPVSISELTPVPEPDPLPETPPQPAPQPVTVRYAGFISWSENFPRALLSLPESRQDLLLNLDDLWEGYRVTDITPTLLYLNKDGQVHILLLDLTTSLDIQ